MSWQCDINLNCFLLHHRPQPPCSMWKCSSLQLFAPACAALSVLPSPCCSSVAFGPGNTIMLGVREFPQPNSDARRRYMPAYFQRFFTLMVNQVWCRLWCTATPDMTWQSNTEEPMPPVDWIAVWPLLPLLWQEFCSPYSVQYYPPLIAPVPVCQQYLLPFPQYGCFQFSYISNYTAQLPLICFLLAWKSELWSI